MKHIDLQRLIIKSCELSQNSLLYIYFILVRSDKFKEKIMQKPILVIQLRPEDKASNSEFNAILSKAGLTKSDVVRIRAESVSIKDLDINRYSSIIVGEEEVLLM